jgi:hypothetical protein
MAVAAREDRERIVYLFEGRRVRLRDLIDAELLEAGTAIVFRRPRIGTTHRATVTDEGLVRLEDGRT